jgi:lipoprotein-anchoring transpeptidase ErfK/SrfK/methionine-rich copper-binding protein CopC
MSRFALRSGWVIAVGVVACLLVCAGAAFVAVQYATAASVGETQPAQGSLLRTSDVVVSATLPGLDPESATVELTVDGRSIPADELEVVSGAVRATVSLPDGPHWAKVTVLTDNMFARRMVSNWSFSIDTVTPVVIVTNPASILAFNTDPVVLRLAFREPVDVVLTVDGEEVALESPTAADGTQDPTDPYVVEASAELSLAPGAHRLSVTATDRAGNVGTKGWSAWVDFKTPEVELLGWPGESWKNYAALLPLEVADDQPEGVRAVVRLDGATVEVPSTPSPDNPDDVRFVIDTGELFEGRHTLEYRVIDRGGNSVEGSYRFLVDTSRSLGERPLGPGAEGNDVKALQRALRSRGLTEQEVTGVYDEDTAQAVTAFKASRGLSEGPVLDMEALVGLLGSIIIDRSERKLYLYDGDTLVKTYRVAVGQPQYPTPTGSYRIINKTRNPTWTPPPSPWADGLEPVPPGPDNPLGTRWMGLSAPHVGIHGTYASSSIGTAASHGCIRMHVRDAEDLFDRVYVGTPVKIVP